MTICAGYRSVAHYLVLTQQVTTSTAASQEPSVTQEATTTAVECTQAEPIQVPCDQQPCDAPQESAAAEAQGAQLTSSALTAVRFATVPCKHSMSAMYICICLPSGSEHSALSHVLRWASIHDVSVGPLQQHRHPVQSLVQPWIC